MDDMNEKTIQDVMNTLNREQWKAVQFLFEKRRRPRNKSIDKVYIIFVGEYSDRGEVAAFLTREEAEEFCKVFERGNSWDKAQIVEMPIGVRCDWRNETPFNVYFKEDHSISRTEQRTLSDEYWRLQEIPFVCIWKYYSGDEMGFVTVFAPDAEHAQKIAKDAFMKHLAEKEGL